MGPRPSPLHTTTVPHFVVRVTGREVEIKSPKGHPRHLRRSTVGKSSLSQSPGDEQVLVVEFRKLTGRSGVGWKTGCGDRRIGARPPRHREPNLGSNRPSKVQGRPEESCGVGSEDGQLYRSRDVPDSLTGSLITGRSSDGPSTGILPDRRTGGWRGGLDIVVPRTSRTGLFRKRSPTAPPPG